MKTCMATCKRHSAQIRDTQFAILRTLLNSCAHYRMMHTLTRDTSDPTELKTRPQTCHDTRHSLGPNRTVDDHRVTENQQFKSGS